MSQAAPAPLQHLQQPKESTRRFSVASCLYPPPEAELLDKDAVTSVVSEEVFAEGDEAPSPDPSDADVASLEETLSTSGGAVWHARVLPDSTGNSRDLLPSGEVKPQRPMPTLKASELLNGLEKVDGRWLFKKPLNGWPGLVGLELRSLTKRKTFFGVGGKIVRLWNAGGKADLPKAADIKKPIQATLVTPSWAAEGWASDAPGFVWWYASQAPKACLCGEQILAALEERKEHAGARATNVHAFAHRYPVEKETLQDRQTWHAGILVEWSHGSFTSLIELAWLNGCGGYSGRSNWCEDKMESPTQLYQVMPAGMKCPWDTQKAEVRILDMPLRGTSEFEQYLHKYSEKGGVPATHQRFLEPRIYDSSAVRLRFCSPSQLAGYLLNYASRAGQYEKLSANCQTFAADLFAFLAGGRDVQPYGNIVKPGYRQRKHSFLYEPRRAAS